MKLCSFLVVAGAALIVHSSVARDWPNFQGPSRIGISEETGLNLADWGDDEPPVLWEKELNEGFGGAAISGDEVFLIDREPSEADMLLCLDAATGETKWSYKFEYAGRNSFPGSRGVPLVTDEAVYFIGGFGHVYRINRSTHEPDWVVSIQERYEASPPKWGWAQSPVLVQGVLVIAPMAENVGLAGLSPDTGEEVWKTEGFGDSHSTPTVMSLQGVEQVVFLATTGGDDGVGTTISVEPASGKVLWKTNEYFNKIPITFPTKVDENRVFLTGGYDNGSAMIQVDKDGDDWSVKKLYELEQGTQVHPPFVIGDHMYLLANENSNHKGQARKEGGLMCLTLEGDTLWHTGDEPFMGRGNMILVEGKLLIQDGETGYLRVIDPSPEGYKEIAFADIFDKKEEVDEQIAKQEGRKTIKIPDFQFWSPMALSQGRLIMRGQGMVKCLDLN